MQCIWYYCYAESKRVMRERERVRERFDIVRFIVASQRCSVGVHFISLATCVRLVFGTHHIFFGVQFNSFITESVSFVFSPCVLGQLFHTRVTVGRVYLSSSLYVYIDYVARWKMMLKMPHDYRCVSYTDERSFFVSPLCCFFAYHSHYSSHFEYSRWMPIQAQLVLITIFRNSVDWPFVDFWYCLYSLFCFFFLLLL